MKGYSPSLSFSARASISSPGVYRVHRKSILPPFDLTRGESKSSSGLIRYGNVTVPLVETNGSRRTAHWSLGGGGGERRVGPQSNIKSGREPRSYRARKPEGSPAFLFTVVGVVSARSFSRIRRASSLRGMKQFTWGSRARSTLAPR